MSQLDGAIEKENSNVKGWRVFFQSKRFKPGQFNDNVFIFFIVYLQNEWLDIFCFLSIIYNKKMT